MTEMDFTPDVLRNKGIPVALAKVVKGEDDWKPVYLPGGEAETEVFHVKFTHNFIADIEDEWDGLDEWQVAMETKPVSTLRKTMSIVLMEPIHKVGARLLEGRLPEYNNAIGVAWALANGVDPTIASQLLEQANQAADSQIEMLNQELVKTAEEVQNLLDEAMEDTPGEERSQPGVKQDSDTKNSGT